MELGDIELEKINDDLEPGASERPAPEPTPPLPDDPETSPPTVPAPQPPEGPDRDVVDESSEESFPASDPPAW